MQSGILEMIGSCIVIVRRLQVFDYSQLSDYSFVEVVQNTENYFLCALIL